MRHLADRIGIRFGHGRDRRGLALGVVDFGLFLAFAAALIARDTTRS